MATGHNGDQRLHCPCASKQREEAHQKAAKAPLQANNKRNEKEKYREQKNNETKRAIRR
jgi:hypothetical protein